MLGFALPIDSVQKGDLLFFKGRNLQNGTTGHVSIVVDVSHEKGIQMIHSTKTGLRLDWLSETPYFKKRLITARRIIRPQSRLALNQ
jgi:cell wall-associated NlpC family hydrolase